MINTLLGILITLGLAIIYFACHPKDWRFLRGYRQCSHCGQWYPKRAMKFIHDTGWNHKEHPHISVGTFFPREGGARPITVTYFPPSREPSKPDESQDDTSSYKRCITAITRTQSTEDV